MSILNAGNKVDLTNSMKQSPSWEANSHFSR